MNKKFINGLLLATLMVGSAGSLTSCKDYDDDIDNLQGQIDAIKVDVNALQELIKSGKVISDVTSNNDGIVITMTDGKTYTITNGKDGKDGAQGPAGAPGTSWTIGEDGYWYMNGEKTEYKAVASEGAAGEAGKPGENGKYYVPNAETGCFDIYQDGKLVEATTISWVAAGPTATFTGTELILSNLKDEDGKTLDPVTLQLGDAVSSIAFIPDAYDNGIPAAQFYTLSANAILKDKTLAGQPWTMSEKLLNTSSTTWLAYRLNPEGAFVAPNATGAFVGRSVDVSRAYGDINNLVNCGELDATIEKGVVYAPATINKGNVDKATKNGRDAVVALQLTNGQNVYTSDYVIVGYTGVKPVLVDAKASFDSSFKPTGYKKTTDGIYEIETAKAATDDDSKYVASVIGSNTITIKENLPYNGFLDLSKIPALVAEFKSTTQTETGIVTNVSAATFSDLGFDVRYEFSLPESYVLGADGTTATDQQHFVQLDETKTILSVRDDIGGKTQAIGRTPVVRVDAYVGKDLIATAFMLIKIDYVSSEDLVIDLGTTNVDYRDIVAAFQGGYGNAETGYNQLVGELTWEEINRQIYGELGMSANDFYAKYDNAEVKATVKVKDGGKVKDKEFSLGVHHTPATSGNGDNSDIPGIYVNSFNTDALQNGVATAYPIQIWINNYIHTQDGKISDKDIAGDAAQYVVTLTFKPKTIGSVENPDHLGKVVIKKAINVKETHEPLAMNPNYYDASKNLVTSYGTLVTTTENSVATTKYKMNLDLGNAFKMQAGKTVFDLFATTADKAISNVIDFASLKMTSCSTDYYGSPLISYTEPNVSVVDMMTAETLNATFEYTLKLANGEVCDEVFSFNVQFVKPAMAGNAGKSISLKGNATGTQKTSVVPGVLVKNSLNGETVIAWRNATYNEKGEQTAAAGLYAESQSFGYTKGTLLVNADGTVAKTDILSIAYYADGNSAEYKEFSNNLKGEFNIDGNGVITFTNNAALVKPYSFNIIAAVTLKDFTTVYVAIPFAITTDK